MNAVQGYVATDTEGMEAFKICGECAKKFALENLGIVLSPDEEQTQSWENDNYILYRIVDGDSESYAVYGDRCEYECGAVLDLRPHNEAPISWGELAQLTHETQVAQFGFCMCEDNEAGENPYSDCPVTA